MRTGRGIIHSENRFRGLTTYFDKRYGQKWLFRLFLHFTFQSTRNPVFCSRHVSMAAAEKDGLAKAACRGGVGQALTIPKCSGAGSWLRQKLTQASARDEGKTRIDTSVQDGRDSTVGEEPGPCRSLSSRGAGAAQAA